MGEQDQSINAACWANGYGLQSTQKEKSGFQTASLLYGQRANKEKGSAENFIVNSRMKRSDCERDISISSYFTDTGMTILSLIDQEDNSDEELTELPDGFPINMETGAAMLKRRSVRYYTGDTVELGYLSSLLRAGCGVSATNEVTLNGSSKTVLHQLRTVSSGGGLYPVELYVAVFNVKGLTPDIYRYNSIQDSLIRTRVPNFLSELRQCYAAPPGIISYEKANFVFFLIGTPWRSMRKYGTRGLRFVFHEAGAISQNIHLACTGLGLGSVDCASFYDDDLHRLLQLDGVNQFFLHSIFVGTPA